MTYVRQIWFDGPDGETNIDAAALNRMEVGIDEAATYEHLSDAVNELEAVDAQQAADIVALQTVDPRLSVVEGDLATATDTVIPEALVRRRAVDGGISVPLPVGLDDAVSQGWVSDSLDAVVTSINSGILNEPITDAMLPAGATLTVIKSGSWPVRPTARADVIVAWKGADPSPSVVSSGTGGMRDGIDYRLVTP